MPPILEFFSIFFSRQKINSISDVVTPAKPQYSEEIVMQLMAMDIPRNRCEKAAIAVNNASADAAMNWIFEHMDDPDIDVVATQEPSDQIPQDLISQLCDMGFTPQQAKKALKETQLNMDRAVEWLFSHADEPIVEEEAAKGERKKFWREK